KNTDKKIEELGYVELRATLSKIIHSMPEPWDLEYYKECNTRMAHLVKKHGKVKNIENCSKHLIEGEAHRYKRLEIIVDAIVLELPNAQDRFGRKWFWSDKDLALNVLNMCYFESGRWDIRSMTGAKRGDNGRSFSSCQIWSVKRDKYYRWDIVGYNPNRLNWSLERTRHSFYMAFSHMILHQHRCIAGETFPVDNPKDKSQYPITTAGLARVLAGYGTGRYCTPYHKRPKIKNGKKVRDQNGKVVMIHGYEP